MERFIDDTLSYLLAVVILVPTMVIIPTIENTLEAAESTVTRSKQLIAPEVFASEGRTTSSASIYTVVNGKVITDIHKEVSGKGDVSVSVTSVNGKTSTEIRGADGKDGEDGADGKDGEDGRDGKNGNAGTSGADGMRGEDGEVGANFTEVAIDTPQSQPRYTHEEFAKIDTLIHYLNRLLSLLYGIT